MTSCRFPRIESHSLKSGGIAPDWGLGTGDWGLSRAPGTRGILGVPARRVWSSRRQSALYANSVAEYNAV